MRAVNCGYPPRKLARFLIANPVADVTATFSD